MGLTESWILAVTINQPAKFNWNPPKRAEDYGSYMTNTHTLCRFAVKCRQVLRHTSVYPGLLQKVKGTGAWKVTIHPQLMPKNGWIHTFSLPHALMAHRSHFNFTLPYVNICCLLSKNRNIKIYRQSCACTCVQLGLSHYSKNLGWGGSTTGYWGRYLGLRQEGTGDWRKVPNEELQDMYCSPNITQVIKSRRITWGDHVAWGRKERLC